MLEKLKRTGLVKGFVKLKNDLKPMTFKEKCDHMWEYYKEWLFVVFLVVMGIGLVSTIITARRKDVQVSGMMINIKIEQEGMNYLTSDYEEYLGLTSKRQVVEMDYTSFDAAFGEGEGKDLEYEEASFYASMILPARVTGAMLDYIILDESALKYYVGQDIYMDLREVFTEEEMAKWEAEGRIKYEQQENEIERWPIAIKITDTNFVQDNVNSTGDVYFALSGSSPRPEMCRNAWEYINAWKKDS